MPKRKSASPAMYEVMYARGAHRPLVGKSELITPESSPGEFMLSPGRVLRLPVGYVLLAAAVALVLAIGTYIVGYNRGHRDAKSAADQRLVDTSRAASIIGQTQDPLASDGARGVVSPAPAAVPADPGANRPSAPVERRGMGPIRSDPRQVGVNYFVLMETSERGAVRLAEFCRENGLETYVVPGHNARLFRVIVTPGFASSSRSGPEVKSLETQIRRVGLKWKQTGQGSTNLGDAYPVLFTGP